MLICDSVSPVNFVISSSDIPSFIATLAVSIACSSFPISVLWNSTLVKIQFLILKDLLQFLLQLLHLSSQPVT